MKDQKMYVLLALREVKAAVHALKAADYFLSQDEYDLGRSIIANSDVLHKAYDLEKGLTLQLDEMK